VERVEAGMSCRQMVRQGLNNHSRISSPLTLPGTEAGQTVPHSHFHIVPRSGSDSAAAMTDAERKNLVLGEGPRAKLDAFEGERLSTLIKAEVAKEINRLRDDGQIFSGEHAGEHWLSMPDVGLQL